jgi:hypothetical protein
MVPVRAQERFRAGELIDNKERITGMISRGILSITGTTTV